MNKSAKYAYQIYNYILSCNYTHVQHSNFLKMSMNNERRVAGYCVTFLL